jgi:hypothetical protein
MKELLASRPMDQLIQIDNKLVHEIKVGQHIGTLGLEV